MSSNIIKNTSAIYKISGKPWTIQSPDPSLTVVPFESLFGKIFKPRPVTKVARV